MTSGQLRRSDIYDFIIKRKKQHDGNSPSVREIARHCDIPSTSIVNYHLGKLAEQGLIELSGNGKARMIIVTGGQWVAPGEVAIKQP